MSLHTVALEQKPVDVAISSSGNQIAVLSNRDLVVYALDLTKRPVAKPTMLWRSEAIKDHCPRHVTFIGDDKIYVLTDDWDEEESYLWHSVENKLALQGPLIETERPSTLISSINHEALFLQLQNGAVHQIDLTDSTADLPPQSSLMGKFPTMSPEFQVVYKEGQVRQTNSIEI